MKMKKLKRNEDRLSELPDSLIFHIFWYMPMRDVVRTTILSKRWNKLWTTAPSINLDFSEIRCGSEAIRNFVSRALMLWKGTTIQKFKIGLPSRLYKRKVMASRKELKDVDCWVTFCLANKIQELYLHFGYQDPLPQNLYTCSWLKLLSLVDCHVEINGNVRLNQLKSLTISGKHVTASAINQVLCGSPQLEVFILVIMKSKEKWSIRSNSLKRLSITNHLHFLKNLKLRIWTPNLEVLEISGFLIKDCLLMDVTSLAHATVNVSNAYMSSGEMRILLEEALMQNFQKIQHVQKVVLSEWCIKVLGFKDKEDLAFFNFGCQVLKTQYDYYV